MNLYYPDCHDSIKLPNNQSPPNIEEMYCYAGYVCPMLIRYPLLVLFSLNKEKGVDQCSLCYFSYIFKDGHHWYPKAEVDPSLCP